MKKALIIIFSVILIGAGGYYAYDYFNQPTPASNEQRDQQEPKDPTQDEEQQNTEDKETNKNGQQQLSFNPQVYTSPQSNFRLKYPNDWYVEEAITSGGRSIFGEILSAWNISSFSFEQTPDRGGIPEGSIKIDFEVSIPDEDLDPSVITECNLEGNECEERQINEVTYTRVFKERGQRPSVLYVAFHNNMMYRASSIFGAERGSEELQEDIVLFDEIASTFEVL